MRSTYKNKKKRGLSAIIVTVLLIGLTIVAVGIVWAVVNNLIREKISNTEACFGNFGKVSINPQYTCFNNEPTGTPDEFQFSISIGDIDVEKVIIGISSAGETKSYTLPAAQGTYANVKKFVGTGTWGEELSLPKKNEGTTYVTKEFTTEPDSVKIAPVINGQQCDFSDSLVEIDTCLVE